MARFCRKHLTPPAPGVPSSAMPVSPLSLAEAPIADVVELARGNGMVDRDLAWAELCVRSRGTVRFKVGRILQYGDTDAVIQDAFLTAFVKLPDLRDNAAFLPWIRSIATRAAINVLRSRTRTPETSLTLPDGRMRDVEGCIERPEQALLREERSSQVTDVLNRQMKPQDSEVLGLFYFEGKSIADIAGILNVPEGTVKRRLHVARERFEKLLEDDHA